MKPGDRVVAFTRDYNHTFRGIIIDSNVEGPGWDVSPGEVMFKCDIEFDEGGHYSVWDFKGLVLEEIYDSPLYKVMSED